MNIKQLKKGMIIANYKKLCELLGENVKTGTSKIAQLKEMNRYFEYHKSGNKYIIDEIYVEVLDKVDARKETKGNNNVYGKYIEQLVLDLLVKKYQTTQERKIYLSRDKMLRALDMVNDNYSFGKFNRVILSDYINADSDNVKEFYILNNKNLYETVERAFKSLESKCLVSWKLVTTVACGLTEFNQNIVLEDGTEVSVLDFIGGSEEDKEIIYKETHTTATDEELDIILYAENKILEVMGLDSKKDAFIIDRYSEFNKKVCELLNKTSNIRYYYKSYDVIFHEKVVQELEKISQWILEQEVRQNIKVTLNGIISNKLVVNAEERQNKAIEEGSKIFGKLNTDKYSHMKIERRSEDNYVEDNKNIVNTVINHNKGDVTKQMIRVHNEKEKKSKESFKELLDDFVK